MVTRMEARLIHGSKPIDCFNGLSIGQFFFNMSLKHGDKIAQIDSVSGQKESFNSIRKRSVRAAIELSKQGITSNDIIVFCTVNCLDNIIPILGATYLGTKIASLDPTLSLGHVKHLLTIVKPAMVFVESESISLIEGAVESSEISTKIVVFGKSTKYSSFEDFTKPAENEDEFKPLEINPNDSAILFFSSGTTGLPKAICLSSKNLLHFTNSLDAGIKFDSLMHFTSLYWISGISTTITSFLHGGYRVLIRKFDVQETFRVIQTYKVTYIVAAPIILYKLLSFKDFNKYDLSSLDFFGIGGTPVSTAQLKKARQMFKNVKILFGYGLTEGGFVTYFDPIRDKELLQTKLESCGKAAPGVTLKVVNIDTGELVPPNQKGEICIKTPALMVGYYNADSSHVFDEDGFLKTGDIGYYDEDECFYVIERIKEMFKYQSWHIVPSVIEGVLLEHPAVVEACVFGMPDEIDGEIPGALVVLNKGMSATAEEIADFVAERVLDREKLRAGVKVVDSLPKTPSGKLIRREVRAQAIRCM